MRRLWMALLVVMALSVSPWLMRDGYMAVRSVAAESARLSVSGDHSAASAHFLVLYPSGERKDARLILGLLNRAYPIETKNLAVHPNGPLTVIVYPTLSALARSAGLPADANDIGLYDAGTMRLAAPQSWIQGHGWQTTFAEDGPVSHELGHALLDVAADGNFPAWFNEGVAQYEDRLVTGYVWTTGTNGLSGPLYSMAALSGGFYALPNQGLAYREGLSLVSYLVQRGGMTRFDRFIHELGNGGPPFDTVLQHVYGLTPRSLFNAWRAGLPEQQAG